MKKLIYLMSLTILGIFLIFLYAGCSEETSPVATTTVATTTVVTTVPTGATIDGVASLPAGVAGSISNTRVALYNSFDEWVFDQTFAFDACDANVNYLMTNIVPGNYYFDAWKDNDNDLVWGTQGDYVWWNGSGAWPNYVISARSFPVGTNTTNFTVVVVP